MLEKSNSVNLKKKWILGRGSISTIKILVGSFRSSALSQVDGGVSYLPWMDSYQDHKDISLFGRHQVVNNLLIDKCILSRIESVFNRGDNPLGLMLPEETSFRINQNISDSPEMIERYQSGLELFCSAGSYWRELLSVVCSFVVPIYSTRETVRAGGVGFSSLRARGAIFLSLPRDVRYSRLDLAINLAHELGHQSLMIYQGADRILNGNLDAPIYSVIRKTLRPAINSFHAVIALAFMVRFTLDLQLSGLLSADERESVEKRILELRQGLFDGITTCENLDFTEVGIKIFGECKEVLLETPEAYSAQAK